MSLWLPIWSSSGWSVDCCSPARTAAKDVDLRVAVYRLVSPLPRCVGIAAWPRRSGRSVPARAAAGTTNAEVNRGDRVLESHKLSGQTRRAASPGRFDRAARSNCLVETISTSIRFPRLRSVATPDRHRSSIIDISTSIHCRIGTIDRCFFTRDGIRVSR